jgi:hypothetical protein
MLLDFPVIIHQDRGPQKKEKDSQTRQFTVFVQLISHLAGGL